MCAVTGLSCTYPGQGLGAEPESSLPLLEPVLSYQVLLPEGTNIHTAPAPAGPTGRRRIRSSPLFGDEAAREIRLQLMGQVQLEVLSRLIRERFGLRLPSARAASSIRRPSWSQWRGGPL